MNPQRTRYLALGMLLLCACSKPQPSFRRIALLPAAVLVPEDGSDWLRNAVPVILRQDLATAKDALAAYTQDDSSAYGFHASELVDSSVEPGRKGFQVNLTVRDLKSQHTIAQTSADGNGVIAVVDRAAKTLDKAAQPFSTQNDAALKAYVEAAQTTNAAQRLDLLKQAIGLDPRFGLAEIELLTQVAQTSPTDLSAMLDAARKAEAGFSAFDRARFEALYVRLAHAPLAVQENAAAKVVSIAPNDVEALSTVGPLAFLQNDAKTGEAALQRAIELTGGNSNLRQQLANGLVETRQFARAEHIYSELGAGATPAIAVCAFLARDAARAQQIVTKSPDPLAPAEWAAATSSLDQGLDELARLQSQNTAVQSVALSQAAVWLLALHRRSEAAGKAQDALKLNAPPQVQQLAQLAAALSLPTAANQQNAMLRGYALFFDQDYAAAADVFRTLVRQSSDTDLRFRTMLAASLSRAGKAPEVQVQPFVPNLTGGDPFAAVTFSELLRLLQE